jgi:hypothetical protein
VGRLSTKALPLLQPSSLPLHLMAELRPHQQPHNDLRLAPRMTSLLRSRPTPCGGASLTQLLSVIRATEQAPPGACVGTKQTGTARGLRAASRLLLLLLMFLLLLD